MPKKTLSNETAAAAPVRAAKPKTTKTTATPRVRSVKHSKVTSIAAAPTSETAPVNTHEEIAKIAYGYWEARGFQPGDPEQDWLLAEQQYLLA